MDPLTHVFLPLLVVLALDRELLPPHRLPLAALAMLPDADKLVGRQGLFHALPTLVPLAAGIVLVGRYLHGGARHARLAIAFVGSHLVLDLLDGGPAPLLFPFVREGIGLRFPMRIAFGEGPLGVAVLGPLVTLNPGAPRPGYGTFPLFTSFGVACLLAFAVAYTPTVRRHVAAWRAGRGVTPPGTPGTPSTEDAAAEGADGGDP